MYPPTDEEVIAALKEMMHPFLADDELFLLSAQMMKKGFDALITVGFSRKEALSIVSGQGTGVSFTKK
jgi:hypothetical protein